MSWLLLLVPVALVLVVGDYAARQRMWWLGPWSTWVWRNYRVVIGHDASGHAITVTGRCGVCETSYRYAPPHVVRFRLLDGRMGAITALCERCWYASTPLQRRNVCALHWLDQHDGEGDQSEWARIEDALRVAP
jgi:membrane-bound metal-dependent hydrolase YbcI (DUF457 family)